MNGLSVQSARRQVRNAAIAMCVVFFATTQTIPAADILGPEDFETAWVGNPAVPPGGWTQYDAGGTGNYWTQLVPSTSDGRPGPSPGSGGNAAFYDDFTGDNDVWLISPNLSFSGAIDPQLEYWEMEHFNWILMDQTVLYSTDYNGAGDPNTATWTLLPVDGDVQPWNYPDSEDVWVMRIHDLSALEGQVSVYIGIRYRGTFVTEWYVDDFRVSAVVGLIFIDGFESGNMESWSGTIP